jgi:putative Holliday junction resolvase
VTVLVGIDLGDRRIGMAVGDSASGSVKPVATLRRGTVEQDAAAIGRICAERGAEALVVGLPLHADGSEGDQSRKTRAWADAVRPLIGLPLGFRDERLTSESAEARLGRAPRGRSGGPPSGTARRSRRARLDREAAALIVQAELDARADMLAPADALAVGR